uniref:acid phosphatase n=1 Tax=Timema genevievae TaxID=629358 RepID=A0A7R9K017_TIMGE|nr:unnamed protein product [Timema genevievae]
MKLNDRKDRELSERGGVGTSARYLSLYTSCLVLAVVMLAVLGETTESPHLTLQQVSVIIPPRVRRCHAPSKRSYLVSCVHLQVFRHGDRNILSVYPFDPYHDNMTVWTEGIGQLTNRGKLQMWELGRYLRQRYGRLVPELYSPEDTLMTSSDVDRCLMSAQLVLAGLYPARGSQVWNPSLDWQPIPVHSTNPGQDKLIRMDAPCPAYSKEYELANNSSVIQNFTQEHADVFRIINEQGWPATRIDQINGVYDSLKIEESRGLILPDWATSIYPDKLREVLETYEAMRVHTPFMQKLISGPLLKAISGHMTSKMAGSLKPDRKLFLYSGHDSTITALLQGLGFPRKFVVEYGAALFFELYSTSDGLGTVKGRQRAGIAQEEVSARHRTFNTVLAEGRHSTGIGFCKAPHIEHSPGRGQA